MKTIEDFLVWPDFWLGENEGDGGWIWRGEFVVMFIVSSQ